MYVAYIIDNKTIIQQFKKKKKKLVKENCKTLYICVCACVCIYIYIIHFYQILYNSSLLMIPLKKKIGAATLSNGFFFLPHFKCMKLSHGLALKKIYPEDKSINNEHMPKFYNAYTPCLIFAHFIFQKELLRHKNTIC